VTPAADVVIVGGGLVGAALAYELASRGVDAVLVDRADRGRASDAGAGILSPETTRHPDPAWFEFACAAGRHYRDLVVRLDADGVTETGFAECGILTVALHENEDEWFSAAAELVLARSPGAVEEIPPADAAGRFPPLAPVWRALYSGSAARVDGRRMRAALVAGAERRGVRVRAASVLALEVAHGRVTGVVTDDGRLACGALVVAGGAWSSAFEEQLGVALPVHPLKGQIVHLGLPGADSAAWPIVQPVLNHYLVAWPDGRVACGGTLEADAGYDTRVTATGVHQLLRECLRIAPGLGAATLLEVRVGLRPASADDLPLVGPVPGWENVAVCTGHGTEGLLLGPYSALLVARALSGDASAVPDAFRPARFA